MSETILSVPVRHWHCNNCEHRSTTQNPEPHTQLHECPAAGGLSVPAAEVESHDHRADIRHVAQLDVVNGERVITSIGTEHGSASALPGRVDRTIIL